MDDRLFAAVKLIADAVHHLDTAHKNLRNWDPEKVGMFLAQANQSLAKAKDALDYALSKGATGATYRAVRLQYATAVGTLHEVYNHLQAWLTEKLAPDLPPPLVGRTPKFKRVTGTLYLAWNPLPVADPALPGWAMWAAVEPMGKRSSRTLSLYASQTPPNYSRGISRYFRWDPTREAMNVIGSTHVPPIATWVHESCTPAVIRACYYAPPPMIGLRPMVNPEDEAKLRDTFAKWDRPGVCTLELKPMSLREAEQVLHIGWSVSLGKLHEAYRAVEDRIDPEEIEDEKEKLEATAKLILAGQAFSVILAARYMAVLSAKHLRNLEDQYHRLEPHEVQEVRARVIQVLRDRCRGKLFKDPNDPRYEMGVTTQAIDGCVIEAMRILREAHERLGSSTIL